MRSLRTLLIGATNVMGVLSGIAITLMLVMVMLDVTLKYLINQPIPGTLELVSNYFMPLAIFFAFPYIQKNEGHIGVTLFTDLLPARLRDRLHGVICLIGAVYLVLFAWVGAQRALQLTRMGQETGAIYFDVPIWPPRWGVPVALGLMAAWLLVQGLTYLVAPRRIDQ